MVRVSISLSAALTLLACGGSTPGTDDAGVDAGPADAGPGAAPCPRDAGAADAGVARGLTTVCTDALVLSGLGLRWDDGSHRISQWGVFPRVPIAGLPDVCPPTSDFRSIVLVSELQGGPETLGSTAPGGEVLATYHAVGVFDDGPIGAADGGVWQGLELVRGHTNVDLDATGEATAPALFDLARNQMDGAPAVVVILDGLELQTDLPQDSGYPADYDPANGYSTRGIGAWIDNVERTGTDLHFEVGARFALGTRDRPAMNAAVAVARTRAVVHYAVVALPVEPAHGTVGYRVQSQASDDPTRSVCRPDASTTALSIAGQPGLQGAPALTSFRLSLFPDQDGVGEDVRELSLRVTHFQLDASGQATMQVEGYASNDAPPPPTLGMDYRVDADVALLQWNGSADAAELVMQAPVTVGRSETMLPLTPN